MSEVPAGWRISRDYTGWNTEWSVSQWQKIQIKRGWFRKPTEIMGWKTLYSNHMEHEARKWAADTIAAIAATKKEKTCACSDGQ